MDEQTREAIGSIFDPYDEEAFGRDVVAKFPQLESSMSRAGLLIHDQMSILGKHLLAAVAAGDKREALRVCGFLAGVLRQPRAIPEIRTTVAISFVRREDMRRNQTGLDVMREMSSDVSQILEEQARQDRAGLTLDELLGSGTECP